MQQVKILLLVLFALLLILSGCAQGKQQYPAYYSSNLAAAIEDINNQSPGKQGSVNQSSSTKFSISLVGNQPTITLLTDMRLNESIILNNIDLNLSGHILQLPTGQIKIQGKCKIYDGAITSASSAPALIIQRGAQCEVSSIDITSVLQNSKSQTHTCIQALGKLVLTNSTIDIASVDSNEDTDTIGIYGNIFSNISIDSCTIRATSDWGQTIGIYNADVCAIADSTICAQSNYKSDTQNFTSCAIGCMNYGTLDLVNCQVYGVHSGVDSIGALTINAGTYQGYGHGGVYCAGSSQEYTINNATLKQAPMPQEYEDYIGGMQGGLYIGGGKNKNNMKVYVDNCKIIADKNPIVLRGTSGEQNNSLYITNTTIDVLHIRVDNNTHSIYLGEGCNFDITHIDLPEVVK